jgi:anaerobic ribonucleoside-triphosphate reductase activating protein
MLKYTDSSICLIEIPDEISLGISITGCPNHCKGCHSPHLWDISTERYDDLTIERLDKLINDNKGISCVLFLGGDWDEDSLVPILGFIRSNYANLKTALYSGKDSLKSVSESILERLNYIKIGRFIEDKGGLENPNTNQKLYVLIDNNPIDVTYKFRRFN